MTSTRDTLEVILRERFSMLRDAFVAETGDQRASTDKAEALGGISDAVRWVASGVDDAGPVVSLGKDQQASMPALGAKRAAREIASMKSRSNAANPGARISNGTLAERNRSAIFESVVRSWVAGGEGAAFELDLKQAILVALGQS